MPDLIVIVPTRGRVAAIPALADAFYKTCTASTELYLAIDRDDPDYGAYRELLTVTDDVDHIIEQDAGTMVTALNEAAATVRWQTFAIGFMGDDHRPRTKGWDAAYLEALHAMGTGIVYGNDLYKGHDLPTQVAMTADIVRTLGFMAPAELHHMYVDNFWFDLGTLAGCIRYLPDIVVEHMHPSAGKADVDAGYLRVNDPRVYDADRAAYTRYRYTRMWADVEAVKGLRS